MPTRIDATPPSDYLSQIARLLPPIHALPTDSDFEQRQPYFTYANLDTLRPPTWARDRSVWDRLITEAQGPGHELANRP